MKIIVCLKQVPKNDSILRINESGNWIQDRDLTYEINESDAYGLEAALQLKEKLGGEVVALSLGPARVQSVIKEALARGADRGIHLEDPAFDKLDAYGIGAVISAAAKVEGFDLLLTGLQSDDYGFAQTGVIAAELLGLPHATIVMDVEVGDGSLRVKRELENGYFQWVSMPAPAVLTIQSGINTLRYATLKGIMAAKKKEIKKQDAAALGIDQATLAPRMEFLRVYVPQKSKQTQFIEGSPAEIAAKLMEKLRNEARVF
ncbi:MAG: electron transfer flavoprotein subunit beta/FixA family protein [Acidobacteriota bacterium]|nr:MAG: electron transfer flavoprotein subunit beta/FixA family protein [Acidobacteriota bacterium]